jgi:hypothetical protein
MFNCTNEHPALEKYHSPHGMLATPSRENSIHTFASLAQKCLRYILDLIKFRIYPVRFEVLTAVVMKRFILWDITPCSPLKV